MAQHGAKAKGGKEWGAAGRKAEGKGLRAGAKQQLQRDGKLVRTGDRCRNCRKPLVANQDNLELSACLRCELPATWDEQCGEAQRGPVACSECGERVRHGDKVVDCYVWSATGELKSIELLHAGCDR